MVEGKKEEKRCEKCGFIWWLVIYLLYLQCKSKVTRKYQLRNKDI